MKIALIGFGNVGKGFINILREKDTSFKVVAVVTGSHGTLFDPNGLNLDQLVQNGVADYPDTATLERDWDAERIVTESNAEAIVEASPTNLETAQPALDYCYTAFDAGKHVVLANKGPIALAYNNLKHKADEVGQQLRFEATVMSGTPLISMASQNLSGCSITSARGILNGTTNYILTQMENGMDYADALKKAQELGYAETDPSGDVDGWDAAGKVCILAVTLFGKTLKMSDLDVTGISGITAQDVINAKEQGKHWKLIAGVDANGGYVRPECLPATNPLATVPDATNAITFTTDLLGDVTIIGAGAGGRETGFGILADLLLIEQGDCN